VETGAQVVASARLPSRELMELAQTGRVIPVAANAATAEGAARLAEVAKSRFGAADILVNNIGATDPRRGAGFLAITDEEWDEMVQVNLMSVVRTTRAALPLLMQRGGAIVNISTMNAIQPAPPIPAYSAVKAAVTNLSRSLAEEFGPRGVRVNPVAPGPTRTAMWDGVPGGHAGAGLTLRHYPRTIRGTGRGGPSRGVSCFPAGVDDHGRACGHRRRAGQDDSLTAERRTAREP